MASILRFDNWQNSDGTSIATTDASGNISFAGSGAGKILQVVSTAKTDTFSTTSTTAVDVTGLSASITPSSASNNVLVTVSFPCGMSATHFLYFKLDRNGTDIFLSSDLITAWSHPQATSEVNYVTFTYLDSPASTSAQTYKLQMHVGSGTGYIGRRGSSAIPSIPSSITVMEVAA